MRYGLISHVTPTGINSVEYGQILHVTRIGKYYCKNMKYRINIYILEKWFPLWGDELIA